MTRPDHFVCLPNLVSFCLPDFLTSSGLSVALTKEYSNLQRLTKEKKQKKKKDKRKKGKKGRKGSKGKKEKKKRMVLLQPLVLVLVLVAVGGTEGLLSWFACQWIYPKSTAKVRNVNL